MHKLQVRLSFVMTELHTVIFPLTSIHLPKPPT